MGSCTSKGGVKEPGDKTENERPKLVPLNLANFNLKKKIEVKPSLFVVREVGVANEDTVKTPLIEII